MTLNGSNEEIFHSKVDPCAKCGKRVMENSVMYTKCGKLEDDQTLHKLVFHYISWL